MNLIFSKSLNSLADLSELASLVNGILTHGSTVLLCGDLGAGKTTFVASFCKLHNISGVQSPTYSIHNRYRSDTNIQIDHFDLYRLTTEDEIQSVGFFDLIKNEVSYRFVEWPERVGFDFFSNESKVFRLDFFKQGEGERKADFYRLS